MKKKRFTGQLLSGHKEAAVEVPFNPAESWGEPAKPLWHGRRGHGVRGVINEVVFESVVVPRSRRFYLLSPEELQLALGASAGDEVRVTIAPAS